MRQSEFTLSDFDFDLPQALIAQEPAASRSASRLLVVDDPFQDRCFKDLLNLIHPGDVLIFNNSKVIPARLKGTKPTGGQVEILVERIVDTHHAIGLMRVSKKPAPGTQVLIDAKTETKITVKGRSQRSEDLFEIAFERPVLEILSAHGEVPLPPYIEHAPTLQDRNRYQTVYAQHPGSVAAPTAGLHFDFPMLEALNRKGIHRAEVTLHVGIGTFAPVRTENLDQHRMHAEWCEMPQATAEVIAQARKTGNRVIAVGTTSLRTLESAAIESDGIDGPGLVRSGSWETDIFIRPGYSFKVVDGLLTNFHLPKSTLLMLVAAFIGYDKMRAAYQHAINARYRFFSYGDAMFCPKHL
jgi:S-adenosylmethionine:tRNA ribosyltransferase-isomerase